MYLNFADHDFTIYLCTSTGDIFQTSDKLIFYKLLTDPLNKNEPEECCNRPPHLKNPYCMEIEVPQDDYFYARHNVKCQDFVRAFPAVRPGCRLG